METDILNPTSTDALNPDYGYTRHRPITHLEAKAVGGPAYMRDVTDAMHVFELSWGSQISNAKLPADMKRLKQWAEQFRDGFFTFVDWDNLSTDSGLPRHHVGRFLDPIEPIDAGNLWRGAQGIRFIELPDVPMVNYPDDWTKDSIWDFSLSDFGEWRPSVDVAANWTPVQDPYSAMSVKYGPTVGYDLQSAVTDAFVQLAYVGWGCQIWMPTGPSYGIAAITLDGVSEGTVDLYTAAAENSTMLLQLQDVPLGKHVLKVECTGTSNEDSSGTTVIFDALKIMR